MFSATSLLVLACACAVTVNAQVDDKCTSVQIGNLSTKPAQFQQREVYDQESIVPIPNHPDCVNGETGVYAWVCDNDVPPTAYFSGFNNLVVIRNGALVGHATVDVTVYCA